MESPTITSRLIGFFHKKEEAPLQTTIINDGSNADQLSQWLLSNDPEDQKKAMAALKLMNPRRRYLITCKVAEIKSLK